MLNEHVRSRTSSRQTPTNQKHSAPVTTAKCAGGAWAGRIGRLAVGSPAGIKPAPPLTRFLRGGAGFTPAD